MAAVGFGQGVTGGDNASNPLTVTNQPGATLADALEEAKSRSKQGKKTKILIGQNVIVPAPSDDKRLTSKPATSPSRAFTDRESSPTSSTSTARQPITSSCGI